MDNTVEPILIARPMISYAFINDILHVSIDGPSTIYDLYDFLDELGSLHTLPDELKVFYDLRNASIDLRLDEISLLSKKAEEKTLQCKSVKTAFCVQDPKVTAYAMLFSWLPENSKIKREQFSTKEAALKWLNTD
ncbi:hypothetical protein KEM09_17740 [Carboxylicivirga mesophila]|uniref:STAS/SEC14 domain-containing protein n=1 Tax=Carboxylicivirga mesophila TaxID=1166478 RepID=A0ABS5KDZ6_9BACT|nr:hypothetical protein [Carboxylicivirga mesophila]MBS2213261.1 hypothetical protein [Carboxylicivirga mesophila]